MQGQTAWILFIGIMTACQDSSKLTGDSNVYLDPSLDTPTDDGGEGNESCSVPSTLDVASFQATESENTGDPGISAFSCGLEGHSIALEYHGVQAHCDQGWSDVFIDTSVEFHIKINYGFEPIEYGDCTYNLKYEIDLQDCSLPPGVYQIIAHDAEAEVDLTNILGETID